MKIDENSDPKSVNDNGGIRKSETAFGANANKPGKEDYKKGVVTTSIIGGIILVVAGIIFYSLYHRDHTMLLSQMETQKNSLTGKITERDSVIGEWITTFD
jgi:hypothetical protein